MKQIDKHGEISPHKYHNIWVCLFLVMVTLAVYWQVTDHDFINFDDDKYVTDIRQVQAGLGKESILWSFSFSDKEKTYWHPLTWLSHMLDCELYGLNPGMHHLSNLIFHIASSLLLFWTFKLMTGALWRSFFVAALFALHPLNVESVAWISERKNVLSTFFWMLTMMSYVYYCRRPVFFRYLLTLLLFTLGLLAKPMLVTLPFVLLLLDYWPLGRIRFLRVKNGHKDEANRFISRIVGSSIFRLLLEKVPFLVLSGISIYISMESLQHIDVIISTQSAISATCPL